MNRLTLQPQNNGEVVLKIWESSAEGVSCSNASVLTRLPFLTPVRVAENRVSLIDQLEAFFGVTIIPIQIGMPASGFAPECPLKRVWSCTRLQTKQ